MVFCKKMRLIIRERDAITLKFMQAKCWGLYNWWLIQIRNGKKWKVYNAAIAS